MENRSGFIDYLRMSDSRFNILLKKLEIHSQELIKFFQEATLANTKLEIILFP